MRVDLLTRWEKESDQLSSLFSTTPVREGGQGSGNFGHAGRPGLEGGSSSGGLNQVVGEITDHKGYTSEIYRITDASTLTDEFRTIIISLKDKSVYATKHRDFHTLIIHQVDPEATEDDYARFTIDSNILISDVTEAGIVLRNSEDRFRAYKIVNRVIDHLKYLGLPSRTRINIYSAGDVIQTTAEIGTDDSGHRGHKGRLGHRGGSLPKSGPKVVEPKGLEPRAGTTYGLQPSWNRLQRIEFIKSKLKIRVRDVKLQDAEQHLNTGVMDEIRTKTAVMLERQPDRVIESFLRKGKIEYMWGEGNYDREERAFYRTFNQGRFGSEKVTKGIGAFFRSANNTMVFRLSDTHNFEYFTHELAHFAIDQSVREYIWREAYQGGIPNFDRMTEYSKKNYQEGFAETYFHWINTGRGTVSDYDRDAHLAQAISVIQTVIDGVKR